MHFCLRTKLGKMKSLLLTTLLLLAIYQSNSQGLFTNSYMETTNVGPKAGVQVGYQFKTGHEASIFFQKEVPAITRQETDKPRFYEKEFYGLCLATKLLDFSRFNMVFDSRIGIINKVNFVITPSIKCHYKILSKIHLMGGIGVRSFNPTIQGGIRIEMSS